MSFTIEFEESLVARIIKDKKFFHTYQSLLSENHFESQIVRDLFNVALEYHAKYEGELTTDILKNEIWEKMQYGRESKEVLEDKIQLYWEVIDRIYSLDISSGEGYTEAVIIDFAKKREYTKLFLNSIERINRGGPINSLSSEVAKIDAIGAKMDLGYDYFGEVVPRTASLYEKPEHVVSTGYGRLNRYLGGGLAGGELGLVVGPPNRGKTSVLVNLAVGALIDRRDTVYFVLEGPSRDIALRFDMRLARIDKDELYVRSNEVHDFIVYFSRLSKAKLIIQMFPTESAMVKDLDEFLTRKEMIDGFVPDVIIIDYLNLCKRSTKEDIWVGRNYREGKGLAVRRNKPVWSAVQAKMGSLKNDIITPKDIAEATGRVWADADVILGLCQGEDEEKKKEMRLYLGKNRNRAAKKVIPVTFDKDLMLIEERKVKEENQ